jgi:predicted CopG family antitoxin
MKDSFSEFVLRELKKSVRSDEYLCSHFISKNYKSQCLRVAFWCTTSISVIGKRYKTLLRLLNYMRQKGKIQVVERIERDNNSEEIFYNII